METVPRASQLYTSSDWSLVLFYQMDSLMVVFKVIFLKSTVEEYAVFFFPFHLCWAIAPVVFVYVCVLGGGFVGRQLCSPLFFLKYRLIKLSSLSIELESLQPPPSVVLGWQAYTAVSGWDIPVIRNCAAHSFMYLSACYVPCNVSKRIKQKRNETKIIPQMHVSFQS